MHLIKIGTRFINLDNMTDASASDGVVHIYFNTTKGSFGEGEGRIEQEVITFHGVEAEALAFYLSKWATSVMEDYGRHIESQAYSKLASARNCAACGGDGCPVCGRAEAVVLDF